MNYHIIRTLKIDISTMLQQAKQWFGHSLLRKKTIFEQHFAHIHSLAPTLDEEHLYAELIKHFRSKWIVDAKLAETLRHHPILTVPEAMLVLLESIRGNK